MEVVPGPRPGPCCKADRWLDMSCGFAHHIRWSQLAQCCPASCHCTVPSLAWPGCP
uniref:Uncharacterized protein n=1 Tax=Phocoena sinus TaxID=42100 RepID=A0A8C9B9B4_PHOSS